MEEFQKVYKDMKWGQSRLYNEYGGSGMGSSPKYVQKLISFIQKYILEKDISIFLDIGCGECEWQRIIDWEVLGCEYIGIELISDVVERVKLDLCDRKNMTLIQGNCLEMNLPEADLVLSKEIFQHWPIHVTNNFLEEVFKVSNNHLTYNCDSSLSFFLYNTYRYFIYKELEIHNEVANQIAKKLCNIFWDTNIGDFRPCNFNIYGKKLATFKWKWHFPASLILVERVTRENEINTVLFNYDNICEQIELLTGGIYDDNEIF